MEKLQEFFENLQDRGIVVHENIKGNYAKCKEMIYASSHKSDTGYCFYRKEQADVARDTGKLALFWGSLDQDDLKTLTVSYAILDEARACGLQVEWNGDKHSHIFLLDVDKNYFN